MDVEPTEIRFTELRGYVEQAFAPQADEKNLDFQVRVSKDLPPALVTDAQRLQQILRNLLSNAVKFTDNGAVTLRIAPAAENVVFDVPALTNAQQVIAFTVIDTGIGISDDKLSIIFEAFQQADGTTSRRYGAPAWVCRSVAIWPG
ncbi:ATP-binding protein [Micromonospora sp. M12]